MSNLDNVSFVHPFVNTVMSILSMLGVLWLGGWKMGRLELKVDTLWEFMMRRARSEAIKEGVAKRNSPIEVTQEAKNWMRPLIVPIREFYAKLGRHLSEAQLAYEIERQFGDRIVEEVCIPHGLSMGACLLIAIQSIEDNGKTPPADTP